MPPPDAEDPADRTARRAPATSPTGPNLPGTSPAGASALAARRERESAALRANLLRRKQQARARAEAEPAPSDPPTDPAQP
ncbi:MAG: hypothetical protein J0H67_03575 [Rhodospirillales bacterium]|nr:hypothetical protein [Rhodospirillales bacterium]